jgi:CHRD domain
MKRAIVLALMGGLLVGVLGSTVSAQPTTFRAVLSGGDEVPPRDTGARGVAIFRLSADGSELGFRLVVANIENVVAAHIHCGAVGVNGPVGVTLFGAPPAGGRIDGELAAGSVTAPDPGNGCGWLDLDDVVTALESGSTYVNVHTNDGVAPANTGPGDFPGGEIRGQNF